LRRDDKHDNEEEIRGHERHYRSREDKDVEGQLEGGNGDSKMRQGEDHYDPHGDAAMALTVLSYGIRDPDKRGSTTRSEFQGFTEQQTARTESSSSSTEREGGVMALSYSEVPQHETKETYANASLHRGEGMRRHQPQQTSMISSVLQLPSSAVMTPSSSSSALNTSTLAASEPNSPNSTHEDAAQRDTVITPQEQYAPHAPGERIQSVSLSFARLKDLE
jgi:hypothetical protein